MPARKKNVFEKKKGCVEIQLPSFRIETKWARDDLATDKKMFLSEAYVKSIPRKDRARYISLVNEWHRIELTESSWLNKHRMEVIEELADIISLVKKGKISPIQVMSYLETSGRIPPK
jgi:hypothetical protein